MFTHRRSLFRTTGHLALGAACSIAWLGLSGCAASEKSRVEQHLNASVAPGAGPNDDVVVAFGLDKPRLPDEAVAAARERE